MSILGNRSLSTKGTNSLSNWQRDMDNFFQRFNRDFGSGLEEFSPKVEIKEKAKGYVVCAEVPGMKEKDISVELRDNSLIIEGERRVEVNEEKDDYTSSEFSYGSFYRTIPLSEEVNGDTVKASYKDGILTVELEKVKESAHKSKKIPILKS